MEFKFAVTLKPPMPKIGDNPPRVIHRAADRRVSHRAVDVDLPIGAVMNGTIYAGISPDTDKPMYTRPIDAPMTMTFNEATAYATRLDADGHDDWRVPTKNELNVLFNNRAAIGGFDISGSNPAGWYWSASQDYRWCAWGQRFSDGYQDYDNKYTRSSVRLVRTEVPKPR